MMNTPRPSSAGMRASSGSSRHSDTGSNRAAPDGEWRTIQRNKHQQAGPRQRQGGYGSSWGNQKARNAPRQSYGRQQEEVGRPGNPFREAKRQALPFDARYGDVRNRGDTLGQRSHQERSQGHTDRSKRAQEQWAKPPPGFAPKGSRRDFQRRDLNPQRGPMSPRTCPTGTYPTGAENPTPTAARACAANDFNLKAAPAFLLVGDAYERRQAQIPTSDEWVKILDLEEEGWDFTYDHLVPWAMEALAREFARTGVLQKWAGRGAVFRPQFARLLVSMA